MLGSMRCTLRDFMKTGVFENAIIVKYTDLNGVQVFVQ